MNCRQVGGVPHYQKQPSDSSDVHRGNAMLTRILLLSGSISSGKSTLGKGLIETYGGAVLKTKQVIKVLKLKVADDRDSLQKAGEALDRSTGGRWVQQALIRLIAENPDAEAIVVDSVRISEQIDAIRQSFG